MPLRTRLAPPRPHDLRARAPPAKLGAVFFEVEDALAPRYRHLESYDDVILATTQGCFWNVLTGD